jgi:hypothetical protein
MAIIPVLGRLKQEDHKFERHLGYSKFKDFQGYIMEPWKVGEGMRGRREKMREKGKESCILHPADVFLKKSMPVILAT